MSRKTLKKLRSKGLLTLVIAGIIGSMSYDAQAQQDPYFTHYMFNKLQYNPAAAGAKDGICIAGIFHTQWTGYEDQTFEYHNPTTGAQSVPTGLGPKTTGVSIDGKLLAISKKIDLGIGLAVAQDNLGYENNLKFRGAFSGIYNMTNGSSLALGIELGMLQKGVDGTNFIFKDLADPNIPATKVTKSNFNTAAGLYYVNPNVNDLYIGLSSTNINEQDFDYSNTTGSGFSNRSKRHYYLIAGMQMPNFLGNPSLEFMPSLLLKNANTTQVTLTGLVEYAQSFSGGIGYRSELDALSLLLGFKLNPELRIGYSYDFSLNALRKFQGGSHEFQLNYCFSAPTKPTDRPNIELTPRFLNKDPDLF